MKYDIIGDNLQLVTIELTPEEKVFAEAGSMVYMSGNVDMDTKMRGGLGKAIGRKFAGETMFLTEFTSKGGTGLVSFGGNAPGTIKALDLRGGKEFILQKDAFLCAENSVEISITFQKRLGASFFGGEGFILEKLAGEGNAFIHACGDFVEFDLKPDQRMKVDTGSVVGWDSTVDYDIEKVKGIKSMFFGGEGIFITSLKGPGKVLIQSMTLNNLAIALSPYIPHGQTSGVSGGLGSLLRG